MPFLCWMALSVLLARQQLKVIQSIVCAVMVLVMDYLAVIQETPNVTLHHKAMLLD